MIPSFPENRLDPIGRWNKTWQHLGMEPPDELVQKLLAAYQEPHRAYHTPRHLQECFTYLDASPVRPIDPGALELALWFHDAIYDPKASDNEARSAAWALKALTMLSGDIRQRVGNLVMVTKHTHAPTHPDEELLLDIDLSILGASPERFQEYEKQIRQEYIWVPEEAYKTARARILAEFKTRPILYHTTHFRRLLEASARTNLQRSLDELLTRAE